MVLVDSGGRRTEKCGYPGYSLPFRTAPVAAVQVIKVPRTGTQKGKVHANDKKR